MEIIGYKYDVQRKVNVYFYKFCEKLIEGNAPIILTSYNECTYNVALNGNNQCLQFV